MDKPNALKVWLLVTGLGALVAFVLFSIYRGFLPGGDFGTFYVAPAAYALLVSLALLTVVLVTAWLVLIIVSLARRRASRRK